MAESSDGIKRKHHFRSVSVPLARIVHPNFVPFFQSTVLHLNHISPIVLEFIKSFFLFLHSLPSHPTCEINHSFIRRILNNIGENFRESSDESKEKEELFSLIDSFYQTHFKKLYPGHIPTERMSHLFHLLETQIITNIENNIKANFVTYINKLVNVSFPFSSDDEHQKFLHRQTLQKIKNDVIRVISDDSKKLSSPEFHPFINEIIDTFPQFTTKPDNSKQIESLQKKLFKMDTKIETQMTKELGKLEEMKKDLNKKKEGSKPYQNHLNKIDEQENKILQKYAEFQEEKKNVENEMNQIIENNSNKSLPLELSTNPQNFLFSAISINQHIELLGSKPYNIFCLKSSLTPSHVHFNTASIIELLGPSGINQHFGKEFSYSKLLFKYAEHNETIWNKVLRKGKVQRRGKTKKTQNKIYELSNRKIFKQNGFKFFHQITTDGITCSLLFVREDLFDALKKRRKVWEDLLNDYEVDYLENMTEERKQEFVQKKLVGIDPGKNTLITCYSEENGHYQYSNRRRKEEGYVLKSRNILDRMKKKKGIDKIEQNLSEHSKRTLNRANFEGYIQERNKHIEKLRNFYEDVKHSKMKLRRKIKTKQAETKMLRELKRKYGKDALLCLGDWSKRSNTNLKGCESSVSKSLIKLLKSQFSVVLVDEYRTSKTWKDGDEYKELKNVYIEGKKIHELLTPKEETDGVILNRDINASKNIWFISSLAMKNLPRPDIFQRKQPLL